jgi:anhydro-N-acetylmuramic acid kinase
MIYKVIGLMSGSSLDGLDIAYVQLDEVRGQWTYEILQAACLPYSEKWINALQHASDVNVADFLRLHTSYGRYLGHRVSEFIAKHDLEHKVHFIASHGHTVFHEPESHTTCQVGDGAAMAAVTGLPVINDLRAMDVALGGQGAPIVPIGDKLLFGEYDYQLNVGGIANITVPHPSGTGALAFDVCPANQVLNALAEREGRDMDEDGTMAEAGSLLSNILEELSTTHYYHQKPPKSLSNEAARNMLFPTLLESDHNNYDLLHTATIHIARQIADAVKGYPHGKEQGKLLATGGGAFNKFLMKQLEKELKPYDVTVEVPKANVVKFKEALVMALVGTLRWREEVNVLSTVTGASRDSVGGAVWMG